MATKSFPYAVIYEGKFYPANAPIKVKETKEAVKKNDEGAGRKA